MHFSKYSASGNDFLVFQTIHELQWSPMARALCDRHYGIGADGVIALLPDDSSDFKSVFIDRDGSFASMCGNGCRAAAHYANEYFLASNHVAINTPAGIIKCYVDNDIVRIRFSRAEVLQSDITGRGYNWWLIDTGIRHLVTIVPDTDEFDLDLCRELSQSYKAEVNFVAIDQGKINIRTYEQSMNRETLACGTGIAAAFYRAFKEQKINENVFAIVKSGEELQVWWDKEHIYYRGKVTKVFDANIPKNDLLRLLKRVTPA